MANFETEKIRGFNKIYIKSLMKKLLSILLVQLMAFSVMGQSEPFVKSLKDLPFGSTILDAAMLMKANYEDFKPLGTNPVRISEQVVSDEEKTVLKYEAAYFVNEAKNTLVQLYYVNGRLYNKGVYWFYPKDAVVAVETKYEKCTNMFLSEHLLLTTEGGTVRHVEESNQLGRITHFPVKKEGDEIIEGQSGYQLVYTPETGPRGFWVYMNGIDTFNSDLSQQYDIPVISPPAGIFAQLGTLLLPQLETMDKKTK